MHAFAPRNVRLGGVDVRLHLFAEAKNEILRMGRCRTWSVIATTDTGLRFSEVFETYQIRWNIETHFKECRQYLGLGGWQGTGLFAEAKNEICGQVADCTLCLMTHTALTLAGALLRVRDARRALPRGARCAAGRDAVEADARHSGAAARRALRGD